MSTDELDRLERRLEAALHGADDRPVDVPAGRAVLGARLSRQQQQVRTWSIAAVAASVIAVIVTTSVVVVGLRDDSGGLPVAPPKVTLSPSGLPVGVLEGDVDRTEAGAESMVRILVRPDGTGIWNAGSTGDPEGPSVTDYAVTIVGDGPGRAVIRATTVSCFTTDSLTLKFTVRADSIRIKQVLSNDCLVSPGLSRDLEGTTLRIRPLPLELSPSGLPVGLLAGKVTRSSGEIAVTNIRMSVRPDGTGTIAPSGGTSGTGDASGGYEVDYVRLGPGRVAVSYEGPICASARALTFTFTVRGRTLTIDDAQSPGCLVSEALTADLAGTTMRISSLPPDAG